MAVLPIVTGADTPILRTKTKKVEKVTKDVQKFVKDMKQTLKASENGVGLAAPQVGSNMRILLAHINEKPVTFINPEITWKSDEVETMEEGCLSVPGIEVAVTRPVSIIVKYLDEKGRDQERKLEDFSARIVQHEMDHLNGILIVDYQQDQSAISADIPVL